MRKAVINIDKLKNKLKKYDDALTIKKRLSISNTIMFLIPVGAALLAAFLAIAAASYSFTKFYLPRIGMDIEEWEETGEHYEEALRSFGVIVIILIAVVFIVVLFSIALTNRFLTAFIIRRVYEPLELITDGVERVRGGDLDTKIVYDRQDEFTPVCDTVNLLTAKLKQSAEAAQNEEQSRRELFAGISHDLRSPLTSVRAYTEAMLDGVAKTPEDERKYLMKIHSRELDIERMVDQLFLFSKMEMKEYPAHIQNIGLRVELARITAENPMDGVVVNIDAVGEEDVEADISLLERAALNLIENSRKYRSGPIASVTVSTASEGGYVSLCFADDGPGVAEEYIPKLFDAFYRTDPARKNPSGGSGLGLAIVKKAVERMGGSARAYKNDGGGLSVEIKLREAKKDSE